MIEVEDVTVRAAGRDLLRSVNFALQPRHVTALLGPNGAGKSTLLGVACGDIRPAGGTVRMNGRTLAAWTRIAQARSRAVMLQESVLTAPFEVLDVVLMGRAPHFESRESPRDREIAREALASVGAAALERRSYTTLSGGEKQRVQLARALAQVWGADGDEPRYLLLDEPTANLDPRHQHLVLAEVRRFAAAGGGALVILHDLNLALQYADDVVLLKRGSLVASGPAMQALTEETLAAAFELPMRIVRPPDLGRPLIYSRGGNEHGNEFESH